MPRLPGDGSMAERVAVPTSRMLELSEDVPDEVVAGLGLSAVAALGALRRGRISAGDRVLVLGAGGVVGQVALQLARVLGADTAVDTSGASSAALQQRLSDALPEGVDLVIDPVWGAPAEAAAAVLAPGGRLVNLGDSAGPVATLASSLVRSRSVDVLGYTNLSLSWGLQTEMLREVLALAADGRLRTDPEVVDWARASQGWQRQASGAASGRVVISVATD